MSYHSVAELRELGLGGFGERVLVSRRASIHGAARVCLGNDVRIDDYCVLSAGEGGIVIGSHVHLAVFCSLIGRARIELGDFSGLSARVSVYSSSDDYSGDRMTNPTVPEEFTGVESAGVVIGRHVIVGAGSVILPGAVIGEGAAVGALSLVRGGRYDGFAVYFGSPVRKVGERRRGLLEHERRLLARSGRKP